MSTNRDARHRLSGTNDCDCVFVPASDISFGVPILIRHNRDTIRIDPPVTIGIQTQIHANEFSTSAQILNDAKTVAKIVGDEERVAVWTDRDSGRIHRRAIAVVSRRVCSEGKPGYGDEWSFDVSIWTRRCGRDRNLTIMLKTKDPDLVFKSTGNIKCVRTIVISLR